MERTICLCSQYPGPVSRCESWSGQLRGPLFGLAPDGVFRASLLALGAVGSYSTFSPLPSWLHIFICSQPGGLFSVALSVGMPRGIASRVYLFVSQKSAPTKLRGIAPYGVRTFLPQLAPGAILRPSKIKERLMQKSSSFNIELSDVGLAPGRVIRV